MSGVLLDTTVMEIGQVLKRRRDEDVPNQSVIDTVLSWEVMTTKFVQAQPSGSNGNVWGNAFWRTTFADLLIDKFP